MSDLPEKIGKYEIQCIAGRGAMGVVYVGYDPFIDRQVAIKVCAPEEEDDSASQMARQMFFNEAKSAGVLDHPNILRIYDAGVAQGQPYIVMEYVDGAQTLKDHCDPEALLPVPRVVRILHQSATALDYAHRRGVTHRDIKPANIMLNRDGDVKIGDFGIAQRMQPGRTLFVSAYGSPRYMSPEQARDEPVTGQTDLYSLGVSMYELLTGQPPFMAKGLGQLMALILTQQATRVTELRPEVPTVLSEVIEQMMRKDLDDRYQTGAEIVASLKEVHAAVEELEQAKPTEPSLSEKLALARGLKFFNEFSDSELEEVLSVGAWAYHPREDKIISEGTTEGSFYIILSGEVSIEVAGASVGTLGKGECIGELGYLSKSHRTATVSAIDDVTVLKIDSMLMDWASLPCQMRFNKIFQKILIERLAKTTSELARYKSTEPPDMLRQVQ